MIKLQVRMMIGLCLILGLTLSPLTNIALASPLGPVEPATVTATINPGGSLTLPKTVHTPAIPPKPDIIFLADTTGSMQPALNNVKANATNIMNIVLAAQADAQFGVAQYRDYFTCPTDVFAYNLDQAITANTTTVQNKINTNWNTYFYGCDIPESQLYALYQLATDPAVGWRAGSSRIIVWFGDASGHDPVNGITLNQVILALQAVNIRVIAVPVHTPNESDGLNATGQAAAIATATVGVLEPDSTTSDQVADAILNGLQNLPTTVTWSLAACNPNLTVTLTPTDQTVVSGADVAFTETITVASGAPQGTTLDCTVNFQLDGKVVEGFTEAIHIYVPDITPPTVSCLPGTNPAGNGNPNSSSSNGFYLLTATDNVDPSPKITIADSKSSFILGPLNKGTNIKLIKAPGVTPNAKAGAGSVAWVIQLKGEAILTAVDAAGNISAPVTCPVPPK